MSDLPSEDSVQGMGASMTQRGYVTPGRDERGGNNNEEEACTRRGREDTMMVDGSSTVCSIRSLYCVVVVVEQH